MKNYRLLAQAVVDLWPKLDAVVLAQYKSQPADSPQFADANTVRTQAARLVNMANEALGLSEWHLKRGGVWDALPQNTPGETWTKTVWLALDSGEVVQGFGVISLVGGIHKWQDLSGGILRGVQAWAEICVPEHPGEPR